MTIERDSVIALYSQIAVAIERKVRDGALGPAAKLPSEQALMSRYGVSRVTVRQAIAVLTQKGLVETKQGKGTFVKGRVLQHGLDRIVGFHDALIAQGVEPTTKLLDFGPASAVDRAKSVFAKDESPIAPMRIERLYLLRGKPFAIVRGVLTPKAAAVTWQQAEDFPIYRILGELLGFEVAHADVGIRASSVGKRHAALLKLAPGKPLLVMERMSSDASGIPLEHTRFFVVPDSYEVRLGIFGSLEISRGIRRVKNDSGRNDAVSPPASSFEALA